MKIFLHDPVKIESIDSENTPNGDRVYKTPDGKLYPSVTTILNAHTKQGILEWRKRVGEEEANKISRQSANRGTKFHNLAEKYLQNQLPTEKMSILEHEMFEMAKPVLNRIDNIRAQEVGLWSHHLRLAGRVDCVAEFDGKLSIIDFKTSRREKDDEHIQHYYMQAAAYAIMFEERTKIPVNKLVIAIAVEDGFMQIFETRRDKHVKGLLYYRDIYETFHD
jgi:genome maintenance exonuclease 1